MAEHGAQERNLPASEQKLRKARAEGQVARSRDLVHLSMVAGGGMALLVGGPSLARGTEALLKRGLRFDAQTIARPDLMLDRLAEVGAFGALLLAIIGVVAMLLALGGNLGSGGWNFTMKAVSPKFSKLNPLQGIGQIFSGQQLAQTGKAVLLALLLGLIGGFYLVSQFDAITQLLAQDLHTALGQALATGSAGVGLMLLALAAFAIVDVPLQRFMLGKRLRMTLREVKDENKESEGNPEVKMQLRNRMRQASRRRMMAAVPTADLVVTNPTHYAVALKYEEGTMGAPKIVAMGTDLVAQRIRELAREHGVPVLEAPPLARALWAHGELDREIPNRLFTAVAQVLAWVYQFRAAQQNHLPVPPVPQGASLPVPRDLDPHHRADGASQ